MVHHKAVDAVRREQSQRNRRDRLENELAMEPPREIDVVDEVCDQRRVAERVRVALSQAASGQRQALMLAYYSDDQSEIAAMTGTPFGHRRARMRGMGKLQKMFRKHPARCRPACGLLRRTAY